MDFRATVEKDDDDDSDDGRNDQKEEKRKKKRKKKEWRRRRGRKKISNEPKWDPKDVEAMMLRLMKISIVKWRGCWWRW